MYIINSLELEIKGVDIDLWTCTSVQVSQRKVDKRG
jgi:hypothetical protein